MIIHHHLGLGDHIICNGLVRQLGSATRFMPMASELGAANTLVVKHSNLDNIMRMFRDINLTFAPVSESHQTFYGEVNLGWLANGDRTLNFDETFTNMPVLIFRIDGTLFTSKETTSKKS